MKNSVRGVCMARGVFIVGGMCGGGACVAGGCVAGGMHGRGHAWQVGMHDRGVCMAGGVHGKGRHVWQER